MKNKMLDLSRAKGSPLPVLMNPEMTAQKPAFQASTKSSRQGQPRDLRRPQATHGCPIANKSRRRNWGKEHSKCLPRVVLKVASI